VLVATDAAARGIDIPAVTHVVQADFAASAIDFLHRVRFQAHLAELDDGPWDALKPVTQQFQFLLACVERAGVISCYIRQGLTQPLPLQSCNHPWIIADLQLCMSGGAALSGWYARRETECLHGQDS